MLFCYLIPHLDTVEIEKDMEGKVWAATGCLAIPGRIFYSAAWILPLTG